MELEIVKERIMRLIARGEEKGFVKADFYEMKKIIKIISRHLTDDNANEWKELSIELEKVKKFMVKSGLLNRYSRENVNYVLKHSKLLPLVLANNTHSEIKLYGENSYMFLCQIHREKTPSMGVTDNKNLFHCFGCGEEGSFVNYFKWVDELSFIETIELLSQVFYISEKIKNPALGELVKKYRETIVGEEYYDLLIKGRDRLIKRAQKQNPSKIYYDDYDPNYIEVVRNPVEDIERMYEDRFRNIDRIRNGIYDPEFKHVKGIQNTKKY